MASRWPLLCSIFGQRSNRAITDKSSLVSLLYNLILLIVSLSIAMPSMSAMPYVPVHQIEGQLKVSINERLVYTEASYNDETFESLLNRPIEWQSTHLKVPNLGFSEQAYWFAIRLNREISAVPAEHLLQISNPLLDKVEIYWIENKALVANYTAGDQIQFSERPIPHRHLLFPVPPKEHLLLLIKVQGDSPIQLPLTLWQTQHFLGEDQYSTLFHLLFFGFMLALAAYNLFLFFVIREKAYLWYVLTVSLVLMVQNCVNGINMQFLWPEKPSFNNWGLTLLVYLNSIAIILFTRELLDLKPYKKLSRLMDLLVLLATAGAISVYFLPYKIVATMTIVFITAISPTLIFIGSFLWYKGQMLAKLYTIAWVPPFASHIFVALSKYSIFPHSIWVEHSVHLSCTLEGLLLSFALAYRINIERQKRMALQQAFLAEQQSTNEKLEEKVKERTLELENANQKLHQLSIIDDLTQLNNRKYFNERFNEEWRLASRRDSPITLLLCDIDNFKQINDQYGHLCGDECLRHTGKVLNEHLRRTGDFVGRYGGEEFAIVYPGIGKKDALNLANELREKFASTTVAWAGNQLNLTMSIGVYSSTPLPTTSVDMAIDHADKALYRAKQLGRNRCELA